MLTSDQCPVLHEAIAVASRLGVNYILGLKSCKSHNGAICWKRCLGSWTA